jgi:ketol-acid reductoisomerase
LKDSGVDVVVALREGSVSAVKWQVLPTWWFYEI